MFEQRLQVRVLARPVVKITDNTEYGTQRKHELEEILLGEESTFYPRLFGQRPYGVQVVYRQGRTVNEHVFELDRLPEEAVDKVKTRLRLYPVYELLAYLTEAFSSNQLPDVCKAKFFDSVIRKNHPQLTSLIGAGPGTVRSSALVPVANPKSSIMRSSSS